MVSQLDAPDRAPAATVAVRVAGGTIGDDLRAVRMVWKRELIRFFRNRIRIATSLVQPILFLFVLGTGLSPVVSTSTHVNFRTFMFPGVMAMAVLFTAIFSAISIVWDREFGFLREMLVAPVGRHALVVGKCLGGASVATFQGVIIVVLAGAVGVPYDPAMIFTLFGELLLLAFTLTAFGVMAAARIQQIESFQMVMQFLVLPMFFLSGAVFPLSHLPAWLRILTRIDPVSYAVDPMRRVVFGHLRLPATALHVLNPGITWDGWRVPTLLELALVLVLGLGMLLVAVWEFSRPE
ncbi:MAG TPA: ABC transporter permease [Acidimicrobiales bacterium]|nr:ABC transporter permease [Acidimicrobiales bacterium]